MKVAVFGAGGVGGYFGGRLAQAGAKVHLIARGAHLEALRRRGLQVRSSRGEIDLRLPATDEPAEIGTSDLVLFCVKSYDTVTAARQLTPLIGDGTAVVSLQNGVDNEAVLAAVVGAGHVMGGVAFIFASVTEPGVILDAGGPGSLVFGELDGSNSERGRRLLALCQAAGIPTELAEDIRVRLWEKFAFICAQAGMTAGTRLPLGPIQNTPEAWAMFRAIVEEVVALASTQGVDLAGDTVDRIVGFAAALDPTGYSSLYHDLVGGRRIELDALHGYVTQHSRTQGLAAPMNEAIYALLKPYAAGASHRNGDGPPQTKWISP